MNRLRALIRSVFGFSRTETNGFLILLPLIAGLIFFEPISRWIMVQRNDDLSATQVRLDSLVATWEFPDKKDSLQLRPKELFRFDPNTATEEDLLALGFPGNQAQRILNYRAKGGKFKVKSDLAKIYGMDSTFFAELIPFINLPDTKVKSTEPKKETVTSFVKPKIELFDLNLADTAQLKSIYGIGPVLSVRIVKHRSNLGGFISTNQLAEVYGLDSMTINRLVKKSFIQQNYEPVKLDINHADEKTLALHPYIKSKLAKALVTYRFQHGNFKTIADLQNIQMMKPEMLEKLSPYLTLEE